MVGPASLPEALIRAERGLRRRGRLWVAWSGGRDSTVLLHALRAAGIPGLGAIHVDHGLQPASAGWARDCGDKARRWGIECRVLRASVTESGDGPEAAARAARWGAFDAVLAPGDVLALAHHAADQVETVLLQALRGAGPEGLAGMRESRPQGRARAWRPLLHTPPSELADYAARHRLAWIEDPQNADPRFRRVVLRRAILPAWRRLDPDIDARVQGLAADCRRIHAGLSALARRSMADVVDGDAVKLPALAALPVFLQQQLLREWSRRPGRPPLSAEWIDRLQRELIGAAAAATPRIVRDGQEYRRYRDRIYRMPELAPVPLSASDPQPIRTARTPLPAGAGRLQIKGPAAARAQLAWAFPAGGERLKPAGDRHHRSLKQLFQQAGVSPWIRERTPLVWQGGELACIPGIAATESHQRWCARHGVELRWAHDLVGVPEHHL